MAAHYFLHRPDKMESVSSLNRFSTWDPGTHEDQPSCRPSLWIQETKCLTLLSEVTSDLLSLFWSVLILLLLLFKVIWDAKSRLMFHGICNFWYMNVIYSASARLKNWKTLMSGFSALTTTPSTPSPPDSLPSAGGPHCSLSPESQGTQVFWFRHHSHVLFLRGQL